MHSFKCMSSYRNHPSLKEEPAHMLMHMDNNEFLFYNAAQQRLDTASLVRLIYDNAGDPYREFCRLHLVIQEYPGKSTLEYIAISEEDGKYLYLSGAQCTPDVITAYKWDEVNDD
jgi:hypothetical protein